ncbi:MAG: 50S ribosomal protein L21 [Candidatus Komeilibacteria bacterium]|nr:50S ribosomal protein L21 [Candidatus Komeilibacteria bacterium]
MKLAVIKTGGKQYQVSEGDKLKIEKIIKAEVGSTIDFDEVLLVADGEKVEIGKPTLNVKVTAKVLAQGKSDKVRVVKYKPKVRYHKVFGHRQAFTEVQIEHIG